MATVLPSEYRRIVDAGVAALDWVEAQLHIRVAMNPHAAEMWLAIRDARSLSGRLAAEDDWAWQTGFAGVLSSPQDLGVLDEFARQCEQLSPYRSDGHALVHAGHLRGLRAFLTRYQARDFDFENADTYPHPDEGPPAG